MGLVLVLDTCLVSQFCQLCELVNLSTLSVNFVNFVGEICESLWRRGGTYICEIV